MKKRKALFVGVNEYADKQIRDLRCSVRDAHSMNDLFEEIGYETRCLENPGKGSVVQAVSEMTAGLKAGDQLLFYFAGHGFTDSGQHLLFCADDRHELLRFHRAGIPFDLLELETRTGGFDRSFLLDACQSDFLTGTRGGDASTRDLIAIGDMVPSAEDAPGSFYVLRSCSKYEHALEIESRSHGLFTLAMMDVIRQSRRSGTELLFNDALRETVREKMYSIARGAGMTANQTPESDGRGALQVLISGRKTRQAKNDDSPKRSTKKSAESRQNRQEVVHDAGATTCQALPAVAACCFYEAGQYRLLVKKWPEGVSEICITAPGMSPMYRKQEVFNTNRIYLPSTVDARKTEIVVQAILRSGDEVCAYGPRTKVSFKGTKRTLFVSLERVGGMFKKGAWGITVDVDDESPLPKLTVVVKKSDGSKTEHLVHEGKLKPGETFHFPPSWGVARGTVISVMKPDEFTFIKYRTMKKIQ